MKKKIAKQIFDTLTLRSLYASLEARKQSIRTQKEQAIDKIFDRYDSSSETQEDFLVRISQDESELYDKAANLREKELTVVIQQLNVRLVTQAMIWVLVFIGALIFQHYWAALGADVELSYYSSLAQIFPVILIALYITSAKPKPLVGLFKMNHQTVRLLIVLSESFHGIAGTFIGTVACLIVLATGVSSSFLLLTSIICLVMVILGLLQNLSQS